jgi:hypothetical protein
MRTAKILLGLFSLVIISFTTPDKEIHPSMAGPWKFIGDKNVNFGIDHDVILFGNLGDDFRQLKLKITDGPLKMYDMKVHFDNGATQDISLRKQFKQGSESRVIDLDGGLRHLSKIEFWYETKGFVNGRSRVAVWGRK